MTTGETFGGPLVDNQWGQNFPPTSGPPVVTAKAADATSVVHMLPVGLRWIISVWLANPGGHFVHTDRRFLTVFDHFKPNDA